MKVLDFGIARSSSDEESAAQPGGAGGPRRARRAHPGARPRPRGHDRHRRTRSRNDRLLGGPHPAGLDRRHRALHEPRAGLGRGLDRSERHVLVRHRAAGAVHRPGRLPVRADPAAPHARRRERQLPDLRRRPGYRAPRGGPQASDSGATSDRGRVPRAPAVPARQTPAPAPAAHQGRRALDFVRAPDHRSRRRLLPRGAREARSSACRESGCRPRTRVHPRQPRGDDGQPRRRLPRRPLRAGRPGAVAGARGHGARDRRPGRPAHHPGARERAADPGAAPGHARRDYLASRRPRGGGEPARAGARHRGARTRRGRSRSRGGPVAPGSGLRRPRALSRGDRGPVARRGDLRAPGCATRRGARAHAQLDGRARLQAGRSRSGGGAFLALARAPARRARSRRRATSRWHSTISPSWPGGAPISRPPRRATARPWSSTRSCSAPITRISRRSSTTWESWRAISGTSPSPSAFIAAPWRLPRRRSDRRTPT